MGDNGKLPNSPNKTKQSKRINIRSNSSSVVNQILLWHSAFAWGIQQIYTPKNTEIEQAKAISVSGTAGESLDIWADIWAHEFFEFTHQI